VNLSLICHVEENVDAVSDSRVKKTNDAVGVLFSVINSKVSLLVLVRVAAVNSSSSTCHVVVGL